MADDDELKVSRVLDTLLDGIVGGSSPSCCPKCGSDMVDLAGRTAQGAPQYGCRACKYRWTV